MAQTTKRALAMSLKKLLAEKPLDKITVVDIAKDCEVNRQTSPRNIPCAQPAVYTLLNIDRGVPEVFGSCYDVRVLLDSTHKMMDGKKLTDLDLPPALIEKVMPLMPLISKTVIGELLVKYNMI